MATGTGKRLAYAVLVVSLIAALAVGLAAANHFKGPLPPRTIIISTGREDGAYYAVAQAYQRLLSREGFTLKIHPGPGSLATLQRLVAGEATVGFVQGGVAQTVDAGRLRALATVFYEPLWVFHRKRLPVTYFAVLRGRRLAIGEEGSGTRVLALRLLAENAVTPDNTPLLALSSADAETALAEGRIDAAFFVVSPRADVLVRLLRRPDLAAHERAARARLHRPAFVPQQRAPRRGHARHGRQPAASRHDPGGGGRGRLAVRDDIHPDLVRLLLGDRPSKAHRRPAGPPRARRQGVSDGQRSLDLPVRDDASRYLKSGPPRPSSGWSRSGSPWNSLDRLLFIGGPRWSRPCSRCVG